MVGLSFGWLLSSLWLAFLFCFLAGPVIGLYWCRWNRRQAQSTVDSVSEESQAEADRLRLKVSSLEAAEERSKVLERTVPELKKKVERLSQIESQFVVLKDKADRVNLLESEISKLKPLANRNAELEAEVKGLREKVARNAEFETPAANNSEAADSEQLNKMSETIKTQAAKIVELENSLKLSEKSVDSSAAMPDPLEVPKTDLTSVQRPVNAGADESWKKGTTKLGTPGADHTDDLKVIFGIGPVMEKTLHGFGITTWEQIAAFTAEDIEKVSEAIEAFPGRIERDDWMGGAQRLLDLGHPDPKDIPE